jgi:uncharacterized protein with NRDE domain
MLSRVDPDSPLVVAANRDERLERPATAITVLSSGPPRILGGRDELAGGTWLAVNEHGVVAGLTNRPSPGGRDPNKRSRGELPLWLAGHTSAAEAAKGFVAQFHQGDFNPCWILVGDRDTLFSLDMTGDGDPPLLELPPGAYVLENSRLEDPTPKRAHVHAQLAGISDRRGKDLLVGLAHLLRDHSIPEGVATAEDVATAEGVATAGPTPGAAPEVTADAPGPQVPSGPADPDVPPVPVVRAPELSANCVHIEGYGTRSALLCRVPAARSARPTVLVADGAPCVTPMSDVTELWNR